jgi:hypothetical protein
MSVIKQAIVDHNSGELYITWKDDKISVKFSQILRIEYPGICPPPDRRT